MLCLCVAGCEPPVAERGEVIRPVRTLVVTAGDETRTRVFPGKVEASQRVELAFQVSGLLVELPVSEGQKVAAGDLIAQLRQDEFAARLKTLQGQLDRERAALRALQAGERPEQIARLEADVRAARARLTNARIEYDRSARLLEQRATSRSEYDLMATTYQVAQEDYQAAKQLLEKGGMAREEDIDAQQGAVRALEGRVVEANLQLTDSTLRAPFAGVIAQRFAERNQNVTAGQPIVKFQDVDEIEVVVDVPEAIMAADLRTADVVQIQAEFSSAPGIQLAGRLGEIAQRADPVTRTFAVRVALPQPENVNLLPGMTAAVALTYRRAAALGSRVLVPIGALYKDATGEQIVWIVGPDQTVSRRQVQVGEAAGGQIEIVQGLAPGEQIAAAGVSFLRAGMRVRDLGDALGGSPL